MARPDQGEGQDNVRLLMLPTNVLEISPPLGSDIVSDVVVAFPVTISAVNPVVSSTGVSILSSVGTAAGKSLAR